VEYDTYWKIKSTKYYDENWKLIKQEKEA
jgi:hypothetical protein